MPINRRCGLLFGKVSPLSDYHSSAVRLNEDTVPKTNGRHEMWPNVYFKPLRASEYGEVY